MYKKYWALELTTVGQLSICDRSSSLHDNIQCGSIVKSGFKWGNARRKGEGLKGHRNHLGSNAQGPELKK